jgi:hypothetical protein
MVTMVFPHFPDFSLLFILPLPFPLPFFSFLTDLKEYRKVGEVGKLLRNSLIEKALRFPHFFSQWGSRVGSGESGEVGRAVGRSVGVGRG